MFLEWKKLKPESIKIFVEIRDCEDTIFQNYLCRCFYMIVQRHC